MAVTPSNIPSNGATPRVQTLAQALEALPDPWANRSQPKPKEPGGLAGFVGDVLGFAPIKYGVLKPLELLAVPKNAIVSGLAEFRDAVDHNPNTKGSFGDWWKQTKDPSYGFGTAFKPFGNNGNRWSLGFNRLAGFVGDVALDPLMYLNTGARLADRAVLEVADRAGKELLARRSYAAFIAANDSVEVAGRKAAQIAQDGLGTARRLLTSAQKAEVGVADAGLYMFKGKYVPSIRLPLSGPLGDLAAGAGAKTREMFTSTAIGKWFQEATIAGDKSIAEARLALARGEVPNEKVGLQLFTLGSVEPRRASTAAAQMWAEDALKVIEKKSGLSMDEALAGGLARVMEDPAVYASASEQMRNAADAVRTFFDETHTQIGNAMRSIDALSPINRLENYFPHHLTAEARDFLFGNQERWAQTLESLGVKELNPADMLHPRRLTEGSVFFEETLSKSDLTVERLNAIASRAGFDGKFFESDARKVLDRYSRQWTDQMGKASAFKYLSDNGVLEQFLTEMRATPDSLAAALRDRMRAEAKHIAALGAFGDISQRVEKAVGDLHRAYTVDAGKADAAMLAASATQDETVEKALDALRQEVAGYEKLVSELRTATTQLFDGIDQGTLADLYMESLNDSVGRVESVRDELAALLKEGEIEARSFDQKIDSVDRALASVRSAWRDAVEGVSKAQSNVNWLERAWPKIASGVEFEPSAKSTFKKMLNKIADSGLRERLGGKGGGYGFADAYNVYSATEFRQTVLPDLFDRAHGLGKWANASEADRLKPSVLGGINEADFIREITGGSFSRSTFSSMSFEQAATMFDRGLEVGALSLSHDAGVVMLAHQLQFYGSFDRMPQSVIDATIEMAKPIVELGKLRSFEKRVADAALTSPMELERSISKLSSLDTSLGNMVREVVGLYAEADLALQALPFSGAGVLDPSTLGTRVEDYTRLMNRIDLLMSTEVMIGGRGVTVDDGVRTMVRELPSPKYPYGISSYFDDQGRMVSVLADQPMVEGPRVAGIVPTLENLTAAKQKSAADLARLESRRDGVIARDAAEFAKGARTQGYSTVQLKGSGGLGGTRQMLGSVPVIGETASQMRSRLVVQFELVANEARVVRAFEAMTQAFADGGIVPNGDKLFDFLWDKHMTERVGAWNRRIAETGSRSDAVSAAIASAEVTFAGKGTVSAADYADATARVRLAMSAGGSRAEYVLADEYFGARSAARAAGATSGVRAELRSAADVAAAKAQSEAAYRRAKEWFKARNPSIPRPNRKQVEAALRPFSSGVTDDRSWRRFVRGVKEVQTTETTRARKAWSLVVRQQNEHKNAAKLKSIHGQLASLHARKRILDEIAKVAPDAVYNARIGVVGTAEAVAGTALSPTAAALGAASADADRANAELANLMQHWMYQVAELDGTKNKLLEQLAGFEGHKLTAADWRDLGFFPGKKWDPKFFQERATLLKDLRGGGDVYRWDPLKNDHVLVGAADEVAAGEKLFRRVDTSAWEPMADSQVYRDAITEIDRTQAQVEELSKFLDDLRDPKTYAVPTTDAQGQMILAASPSYMFERVRYWNDVAETERSWLANYSRSKKSGKMSAGEVEALDAVAESKRTLADNAERMASEIWDLGHTGPGVAGGTKNSVATWDIATIQKLYGKFDSSSGGLINSLDQQRARLSSLVAPPPSAFELRPDYQKMQAYKDVVARELDSADRALESAMFAVGAKQGAYRQARARLEKAASDVFAFRGSVNMDTDGLWSNDPLGAFREMLGGKPQAPDLPRSTFDGRMASLQAEYEDARQALRELYPTTSPQTEPVFAAIAAQNQYETALARRNFYVNELSRRQASLGDSHQLTVEGAKLYRSPENAATIYRNGSALGAWEKLKTSSTFEEAGVVPLGNDVGISFSKEEWDALFLSPFDPPKSKDATLALRQQAEEEVASSMRRLQQFGIAESKGQVAPDEMILMRAQMGVYQERLRRAREVVAATDPKVWSSAQRKMNSIVSTIDPNLLDSQQWRDLISLQPNPDHVASGAIAQSRRGRLGASWDSSEGGTFMARVDAAAQRAQEARAGMTSRIELFNSTQDQINALEGRRAQLMSDIREEFVGEAEQSMKAANASQLALKELDKVVGGVDSAIEQNAADLAAMSKEVLAMHVALSRARVAPVAKVAPELVAAKTRAEQVLMVEEAKLTALRGEKDAAVAATAEARTKLEAKLTALEAERLPTISGADALQKKADKRIADLMYAKYRVEKKLAAQEAVVAKAQQALDAARGVSPDEIAAMHRVTVAEANVTLIEDLLGNLKAVQWSGVDPTMIGPRSEYYRGRQLLVEEGGKARAYDTKKVMKVINDGEDARAALARGWEEAPTRKGGDQVVVKKYLTEKRRRDLEALVERGTLFSEQLSKATISDVEAGRLGELGSDIVSWMDSGKRFVSDPKTGKMVEIDGLGGVAAKEEKALRAVVQQWHNAEIAMLTASDAFNAADNLVLNPQLLEQDIVPLLKDGFKSLEAWGLPSYSTDPWVKEFFDNFQRMEDPAVAQALSKFLGWYTKRFKAYAVASPGFHVRNALDNTFRVFSAGAGVSNMLDGHTMFEAWVSARKSGSLERFFQGLGAKRQTFENALTIYHGSGSGQGGSSLSELLGSVKLKRIDENAWLRANRSLTERVEGSARFMLAYDSAAKGMDAEQGMLRVRRYLFDYSADGRNNLDRSMRQIVPFWTYMSKNLPFQIVNRWKNPKAYIILNDIFRNVQGGDGSGIPAYLMQAGGVDLGGGNALTLDLGQARVEEQLNLLKDPVRLLKDVSPGIRLPLELAGNKRYYNNMPFSNQPQEIPGGPLAPAIGQILSMLGLTDTAGAARSMTSPAPGSKVTSSKAAYALMNSLPPLAQLERLLPNTQQYEQNQSNSLLGWLGIPYRSFTPEQQEANKQRERDALMAAIRSAGGK